MTYRDFDHFFNAHTRITPALHAHLRSQANMSGVAIRRADAEYYRQVDAYYAERERLRAIWTIGIADRSIQVMNRRTRLEAIASGHEDNPSVQAARRLLAKM